MKKIIASVFIALSALGGVPTLAAAATNDTNRIVSAASSTYYRVPENSNQRHQIYLKRGVAQITISGDGDTDLDLYVYDQDGDLVDCSQGDSDDETVYFRVHRGGAFTVKVVNRGDVYNEYSLTVE